MLAVTHLSSNTKDGRDLAEMDIASSLANTSSFSLAGDLLDFPEFTGPAGILVDSIDFGDLFVGDALQELDMDPELVAEFSFCTCSAGDPEEAVNQVVPNCHSSKRINNQSCNSDGESKKVEERGDEHEHKHEVSAMEMGKQDNIESKKPTEQEKLKKLISSSQAKKNNSNDNNNDNHGKRKKKVDWTPDLHRRFVQAVEQLGVDKAVPSRILELMGIDCLTRHNVASHLQKYRSHRKNLLAREAEAASLSQKRQMYGVVVEPPGGGGGGGQPGGSVKGKVGHSWHVPTIGFPPPMIPPPIHHHHHQPFRPLHVWGHPTQSHHVERQRPAMMPIWPKQPSSTWAAAHHPPPPVDPSFWHSHHQHVPAAPCFAQPARLGAPLVLGIPPAPDHPPLDFHPSKESVDAAIGDVLSKPSLPLPIGLKPPSMDGVMDELQRQGIPKVPPSSSSSSL